MASDQLTRRDVGKKRVSTLYTSRKSLQHHLATGVPSCEEPGSTHEQTCKISREELPNPIKQRPDELRKKHFFVSLALWCRLLILVDSCAEWGWLINREGRADAGGIPPSGRGGADRPEYCPFWNTQCCAI